MIYVISKNSNPSLSKAFHLTLEVARFQEQRNNHRLHFIR